jgi:hypothetical protein
MITLSTIAIYKILTIVLSVHCINIDNNEPYAYSKVLALVENSIFYETTSWLQELPILGWIAIKGLGHVHARDHIMYINIIHARYTTTMQCTMMQLVLLSGDVHPHPGPIRYPCAICDRPVARNHYALQCDYCDQWIHINCDRIFREEYKRFQEIKRLDSTFTDSFFNKSGESLELSNSFKSLSECSDTESNFITKGLYNKPNRNTIRIMSVNCRSLISDNKKIAMQDLIETHNPEIILGCESHLDPQINSSEVFPSNYGNPYRKDRKLGEGGVFIAIRNDLITTEIKTDADCEIV